VTAALAGVRIGHLGRQPGYTRDRIVAKALRRAGADVVDLGDRRRFPARWWSSARALRREPLDAVLVSTLSHADVPVDRLLASPRRVPVVFDASIALYESMVESRGVSRRGTPAAWWLALQDRLACRSAHRVLVDTDAHCAYLAARTGTAVTRFRRIWLGADDDVLQPRPGRPGGPFRVLFYATYSPLHGAEHIVQAAALLPPDRDIEVLMVGSGHTDAAVRRLAHELGVSAVRFAPRVPFAELPTLIADSDVTLGVFGTVAPAARVIPFKVFDGLAMARPVITADTPAAREALVDGEHCRLTPPGDAAALAEAITALHDDERGAAAMAGRGHDLYRARFSIDAQALDLGVAVGELLTR
jgi:glycosyltransferase involved in cell wall biosynthesis